MKGSDVAVSGIIKSFGDFKALKDVSLEIKKGEFFSLLGPSGCGKTTLLRVIAGFEDPDSGSVSIDGREVSGLPPDKRRCNTVFQSYALFPHLTVFENVAFPLRLRRVPNAMVREMVMRHLALVQLEAHADKKPSMLSGGQKQRVAIARALINEPSVLLLDEPLSALDAKLRQHMLLELDAIHDKVGITFIYVTHDQQEALSVSDRIAVMDAGRVLQVGSPQQIYENPASDFVARFIGETNIFVGEVIAKEGGFATVECGGLRAPPRGSQRRGSHRRSRERGGQAREDTHRRGRAAWLSRAQHPPGRGGRTHLLWLPDEVHRQGRGRGEHHRVPPTRQLVGGRAGHRMEGRGLRLLERARRGHRRVERDRQAEGPRFMKRNYGALYAAPQALWLSLFFAAPLAIIVAYSFMKKGLYGGVEPQASLDAYRALANPTLMVVALRTLWVSVVATAITLLIALPCGYSIARSRNQSLMLFLVIVPLLDQLPRALLRLDRDPGHRGIPERLPADDRTGQRADTVPL